MTPRDVFISHSSGDAEVARALRAVIEGAGYTCWMAPDDVVGTETWTEQILGAIRDSKAMIVLISSAANASPHVSREVNLALGRSRAVLPIRIEGVAPEGSLEYLLSLVQRVDAFPPPIDTHRDRILRRLESIIGPAGAPALATTPVVTPSDALAAAPTSDTNVVGTGAAKPRKSAPRAAKAASSAAKGPAKSAAKAAAKTESATTETPIAAPTAAPIPLPPPAVEASSPADDETVAAPPTEPPKAPKSPVRRRRGRPADVGPGSVVGGFTIESMLGEGGMATVYRARQDEPRRLVALKVIRADHAANQSYRQRFLTEKDTLAALEHPVIVPIYAAGESDGVLFIAMRLVDGPDLQARITRQGRLSLRETVQILEPIADAVDYAHAMGVIHRDLKPSNIILDRDGRPYLTDFGLGKRLQVDTSVSVPGMAIGTLDFMAPEQFTGPTDSDLAPAIDLYALGCVAFACLAGQPPFVRPTPEQLMYAHAHEAPPTIRSIRPEYPPVVDEIFARILAKDPAARFGSAREFISALEAVVQTASAGLTRPVVVPDEASPAARARSWVGRNTLIAVGGGAAALVLAVALAAGLVFKPGSSAQPTQAGLITPAPATIAPTVRPTEPPVTVPPPTGPPVTVAPGGFPDELEAQLLSLQPDVVDVNQCQRFEDKYEAALAMVFCPGPVGASRVVFFALYEDVATMAADYDGIMGTTTVAQETTTGCFDLVSSNHGWSYVDDGVAGPQAGTLGCYPRSEEDFNGIQYLWTLEDLAVMGLWLAPDYEQGLDYFNEWVLGARP